MSIRHDLEPLIKNNDHYRQIEKEAHQQAANGDWDNAIKNFKRLPKNWDIWQQIPSMGHNIDHNAMMKLIQHAPKDSGFGFEMSHNLPEDASPEALQKLGEKFGDDDGYVTRNVSEHPNFKPDEKFNGLKQAGEFWNSYEKGVSPEHFATTKSMFSGKPESFKSFRNGEEGHSTNEELWPHLLTHAQEVRNKVMADKYIPKKMINNEPHVKVYRGIGGDYGKAIHEGASFNPETNTVKSGQVKIPVAPLSSWSTNKDISARFAHGRGSINKENENEPDTTHGVVIESWMPVSKIIHSGLHRTTFTQDHPHADEDELVFGHTEPHQTFHTKDLHFQRPEHQYGDVEKANVVKKTRQPKAPTQNIPNTASPKPPITKSENDLEKGMNGDWKKEGYTFSHNVDTDAHMTPGVHYHKVKAFDKNGKEVGNYSFSEKTRPDVGNPKLPEFYVSSAQVHKDHRRKGLASEAYRIAEDKSGKKLDRGWSQTKAAEKLCANPNRSFGKNEEVLEKGTKRDMSDAADLAIHHRTPEILDSVNNDTDSYLKAIKDIKDKFHTYKKTSHVLNVGQAHKYLNPIDHKRIPKSPNSPIILGKLKTGHHILLDGNHRIIHAKNNGVENLKATVVHLPEEYDYLSDLDNGVAYKPKMFIKTKINKNEETDLFKAPIILQDYLSDRIGSKEMIMPSVVEASNGTNTNKMKSGLYHHTLEDKNNAGDIIHGLSTSSDPYDHAAYVAKLEGYKEKTPKGYKLKAQLSQVRPEHKGKGYGKQLYLAALAHHGEMDSDNKLTNRSNKVWESLPEISNGAVKVKLAGKTRLSEEYTDPEAKTFHSAIADQDALKSMLYDIPPTNPDSDPWDDAKYERGGEKEYKDYKHTDNDFEDELHDSTNMEKSESKSPKEDKKILDEINLGQHKKHKAGNDEFYGRNPDADLEDEDEYDGYQKDSSFPVQDGNYSDLTVPKLYRSYKNTPHRPESLFLKYAIHRIENRDSYKNASDAKKDKMDKEFLNLHQQGNASEKNGHIRVQNLRDFIHHAGGKIIPKLLQHQRSLHNSIKQNYGHNLTDENGMEWSKDKTPHVALTRGLNSDTHGEDHSLASYADKARTGFGSKMFHYRVPLDKVWYSYDMGPKSATSEKFGNENEWLVSNHKRVPANGEEIQEIVPRSSHSHRVNQSSDRYLGNLSNSRFLKDSDVDKILSSDNESLHRDLAYNQNLKGDNIRKLIERTKESNANHEIGNVLASHNPNLSSSDIDHIFNSYGNGTFAMIAHHPNLQDRHIEKLINSNSISNQTTLANRKNLSHKHIDMLLNAPNNPYAMQNLAGRNDLHPSHVDKLLNSGDGETRGNIIENPSLPESHMDNIMNSGDEKDLNHLARNPSLKERHIQSFISHPNPAVVGNLIRNNNNLTPDHLTQLANHPDSHVQEKAKRHPNYEESPDYSKLAASEDIDNNLKKGSLQRKLPFNPKKDVSRETRKNIKKWQDDVTPEAKDSISPINENAKKRGLNKLHSLTEVRKHPETGERMFLLHRGMHHTQADKVESSHPDHSSGSYRLSWTPHKNVANRFGSSLDNVSNNENGRTVSAWIPESQIHNILPQLGSISSTGKGQKADYKIEHEIFVNPHKFIIAKQQELPKKDIVNYSINDRAERQKNMRNFGIPDESLIANQRADKKLAANEDVENDLNKGSLQSRLKYNADNISSEKDVVVETEIDKPVLQKPFRSKKQLRFLASNKEKIGGEKGFKEWLSHTPKNIPESVEKSEDVDFRKQYEKDESFDDSLEKSSPTKEGELHPDMPWVGKVHPGNGEIMWHADNEQSMKIDNHLKSHNNIKNLMDKIPESHKAGMLRIINGIKNSPRRHFIPTNENGAEKLRARHLRELTTPENTIKIDTSDPNKIRFIRNSHSKSKQYEPLIAEYENKG